MSTLAAPKTATIYEGRAARIHREGDGLWYPTGDEYRDESELLNIVSQLVGLKVTLGHGGAVVGKVIAGRRDADHAIAEMVITDERALRALRDGTKELSLGYKCDVDSNRFQRGIKLDELSIVDRARCGASCAVRTDLAVVDPYAAARDALRYRISNMWRADAACCESCEEHGELLPEGDDLRDRLKSQLSYRWSTK